MTKSGKVHFPYDITLKCTDLDLIWVITHYGKSKMAQKWQKQLLNGK